MTVISGATVTQQFGHNGHKGIDLAAPAGTPIYASHGGTVIRADYDTNWPSFGWHVRVQVDPKTVIIYGHMQSAPAVKAGQKIAAGTFLGREGATGNATGPHLHYEVRVNGTPVNPAPYLSGGGVSSSSSTGGALGGALGGILGGALGGVGAIPGAVSAGVGVGQIGGAAVDAAGGVVSGLDTIGGFFAKLGEAGTWVRVLQVVGGAALVTAGVVIVGKGVIADVAVQALPGGGVLKAAAGAAGK